MDTHEMKSQIARVAHAALADWLNYGLGKEKFPGSNVEMIDDVTVSFVTKDGDEFYFVVRACVEVTHGKK